MSILAEIFDKNNSISTLQNFTSLNGSYHYNIKPNSKKIKLIKNKKPIEFLDTIKVGKNSIVIFKPDFSVFWEVM